MKVMRRSLLRMLLAVILAVALNGKAAHRLAVIPVGAEEAADQFIASLPRDAGIDLVERSELGRIINETSLQALQGKPEERQRVGKLLNADILLILRNDPDSRATQLEAIMIDVRSGVRLARRTWSAEASRDLSMSVGTFVRGTLNRFPTGPRAVIVLPPFLSKAFVHDFDQLQAGYGRLLACSLELQEGISVVEVEQADAIGNELALSGGEVQRLVPLLVRGEFSVPAGVPFTNRTVEMTVEISDGAKVLERVRFGPASFEKASAWVATDLAKKLLGMTHQPAGPPLSMSQQAQAMRMQASALSTLGSFKESAALREAVLLLAAEDAETRRKLVAEYAVLIDRTERTMYRRPHAETQRLKEEQIKLWRGGASHLDYLLLNSQIALSNYVEAAKHFTWGPSGVRAGLDSTRVSVMNEARERLVGLLPAIARLMTLHSKDDFRQEQLVNELIAEPLRELSSGSNDYSLLQKLLETIPPGPGPNERLIYMLNEHVPASVKSGRLEAIKATNNFLEWLTNSPVAMNQVYGRFGLICREASLRQTNQADTKKLLHEAEILLRDSQQCCGVGDELLGGAFVTSLSDLRTMLRREAGMEKLAPYFPPSQAVESLGRLRLEGIPYQLKRLNGQIEPWQGQNWPGYSGFNSVHLLHQANEGLNVIVSSGAILFEQSKALLTEVLLVPKAWFENVSFDGRFVWIASRHAGIFLFDTNGQKIVSFNEQDGLPPADQGMLVQGLTPGRAIAAGSFGSPGRSWVAQIEYPIGSNAIRILHTAVATGRAVPQPSIEQPFAPGWILLPEQADGRRNKILVGCDREYRALEIDGDSHKVVALSWPGLIETENRQAFFSQRGRLFEVSYSHVRESDLPGTTPRRKASFHTRPAGSGSLGPIHTTRYLLANTDGWVYVPGSVWLRIDPTTGKEEILTGKQLPWQVQNQSFFGMAAFHGMVGWSYRGKFQRISVADE